MARLLTVIAEAISTVEPPEPYDWFRAFGDARHLSQGEDRCLLFLGLDAGRTRENSVANMLAWFHQFQEKLKGADPHRLAATVFVIDWPRDQDHTPSALTDEADIDSLVDAGLCYRPKEEAFYGRPSRILADALGEDLRAKGLISEKAVSSLGAAVAPRPAPDPDDPQFREADEFLGSRYIAWPEETIRELLGR